MKRNACRQLFIGALMIAHFSLKAGTDWGANGVAVWKTPVNENRAQGDWSGIANSQNKVAGWQDEVTKLQAEVANIQAEVTALNVFLPRAPRSPKSILNC